MHKVLYIPLLILLLRNEKLMKVLWKLLAGLVGSSRQQCAAMPAAILSYNLYMLPAAAPVLVLPVPPTLPAAVPPVLHCLLWLKCSGCCLQMKIIPAEGSVKGE